MQDIIHGFFENWRKSGEPLLYSDNNPSSCQWTFPAIYYPNLSISATLKGSINYLSISVSVQLLAVLVTAAPLPNLIFCQIGWLRWQSFYININRIIQQKEAAEYYMLYMFHLVPIWIVIRLIISVRQSCVSPSHYL